MNDEIIGFSNVELTFTPTDPKEQLIKVVDVNTGEISWVTPESVAISILAQPYDGGYEW